MTTSRRAYSSPLRESRAQATRQKILAAVSAVLRDGISALTMPAVAKAAGVSLPTVYRYFPDKRSLIDAAADIERDAIGVRREPYASFDAYLEHSHQIYDGFDARPDGFRLFAAATSGEPYDADALEQRRTFTEETVSDVLVGLDPAEREALIEALMVVFSSPFAITLARFGLMGRKGSEQLEWMARTLVAGARARAFSNLVNPQTGDAE